MRLEALREAPYAFGSSYEREKDRPERDWRNAVTTRTRFVAESEGVVVGTASGGDGEKTGVAALTAMWVDPRYRRQGIGGLLLRRVVDWAQQAGYEEIFLWVVRGNEAAEKLYERNAFKRTGAEQEVRPGQLEHEMSKRLR